MPLSEKSDVPVFLAYPVSRESACKPQMELAWPILWIEGGVVIGFAAKKAEPKKAPPKTKKWHTRARAASPPVFPACPEV